MKNCDICLSDAKLIQMKQGYQILSCSKCSYMRLETEMDSSQIKDIYSDNYFFGGKDGYDDYLAEEKLLTKRGIYYSELLKHFTTPGKFLCVGSAAGFTMNGFIQSGWKGKGIEINNTMANFGRTKYGLDIITGNFENIEIDVKFDLVNMIQVISHFNDINKALNNAHKLLNDGGLLLVETWNKDSFIAKLFGENWHQYSPPSVVRWFSVQGLTKLVESHNFKLLKKHKTIKWISSSHAKSLASYKFSEFKGGKYLNKIVNLIPDNFSIPYPGDDLFWAIFQKQK